MCSSIVVCVCSLFSAAPLALFVPNPILTRFPPSSLDFTQCNLHFPLCAQFGNLFAFFFFFSVQFVVRKCFVWQTSERHITHILYVCVHVTHLKRGSTEDEAAEEEKIKIKSVKLKGKSSKSIWNHGLPTA